jgi:hypothetical protein
MNANSCPGPQVCRSVGVMADLLAVCVEDDGSVVGSPMWRRKWDEICARRYRQIEGENKRMNWRSPRCKPSERDGSARDMKHG